MVLQFIKDQLGGAAVDSITVSTLFFLAVIAVLSIKLMGASARESKRKAQQRFATSDEFKQAKANFISRQKTERGISAQSHSKPDSFYTLGMSRAAKKNFYANKNAAKKPVQKVRVVSGSSMTLSDKKGLEQARISRGLSPVKSAYADHQNRNSKKIVSSAVARHSAYKKVVRTTGTIRPAKTQRPNSGRFSDVPNTYSNSRNKKAINGLLSS
jgi:hypothetical protein